MWFCLDEKILVLQRLPLLSYSKNSRFWELEETLENMYIHGIDNVRGSMFSRIKLTNDDKIKAADYIAKCMIYV